MRGAIFFSIGCGLLALSGGALAQATDVTEQFLTRGLETAVLNEEVSDEEVRADLEKLRLEVLKHRQAAEIATAKLQDAQKELEDTRKRIAMHERLRQRLGGNQPADPLLVADERLAKTQEGALSALAAEVDAKKQRYVQEADRFARYRTQLAQVFGGTSPETRPKPAVCRMATREDFNHAFLEAEKVEVAVTAGAADRDEGGVENCLNIGGTTLAELEEERVAGRLKGELASALAFSIAQVLPERANQQPGLTAAFAIASGARANATYTQPFIFRDPSARETQEIDRETGEPRLHFESQVPRLLTVSAGIGVPIDKNKATIVSHSGGESNLASGFSARLGVDFQSFRRFKKEIVYRRTVDFLFSAMEQCAKERGVPKPAKAVFYKHYGIAVEYDPAKDVLLPPEETLAGRSCTGADLVAWVLEMKKDDALTDGFKLERPKLAAEYWGLFWDDGENVTPTWGVGASYEHVWNEFKVRQATLNLVSDPTNPGRVRLVPDTSLPLAAAEAIDREDWRAQAYVSAFRRTWDHPFKKPRGIYTDGVMGLLSAGYEKVWDYRQSNLKGFSLCPALASGAQFGSCSTVNIDRPYRRSSYFVAAEGRTQFRNVPIVKLVGLAPKFTWRLSDDRKTLDLPLYLTANDKGIANTGIRFLHNWDGEDLLGNDLDKEWEVSLFFSTTLNLLGF